MRAAAAVIARNSHQGMQIGNEAVTMQKASLHEFSADSPAGEAAFIVRQVEILIGGSSHREIERLGTSGGSFALGDIAVLYRTGRQAEILAAAFAEQGLPVQVVDLIPFYLSGPALVLYQWVLLAAGQLDGMHLLALLQREQGIGRAALAQVEQMMAIGSGDPWDVLARCQQNLPASLQAGLAAMRDLLCKVKETAAAEGVVPAMQEVLRRYKLDEEEESMVRFLHLADTFGSSLSVFATHLQRYSDSVVYDHRADAVTLMTLHASKGLEFRVVFLAGAEEGLLPLAPRQPLAAEEEAEHIEEERRLFFVGMTRAREHLFLSHSRRRSKDGRIMDQQPSRFLREIPGEYFTAATDPRLTRRRKSSGRQLTLFD